MSNDPKEASDSEEETQQQQGEQEEGGEEDTTTSTNTHGRQNRAEKKARKLLSRLNMRPIPGVSRVTVKRSKNVFFVVNDADVFQIPNTDTYIVFGEAKMEDLATQAQQQAAQQFAKAQAARAAGPAAGAPAAADDDEEVDAGDLEQKDIDLVMTQANVTRSKAIKALQANQGDIVNAIMELTV
jgi:nascent polypeptide-associated complex subunit alpha